MLYEDEGYSLITVISWCILGKALIISTKTSTQHPQCCIVALLDCSLTARISMRKGLNNLLQSSANFLIINSY